MVYQDFLIGPLLIINHRKEINLGLIGAGKWGVNYIRLIKGLDNVNIPALATKNNRYKNTVSDNFQICNSWKELCKMDNLDGLIIATPPSSHIKIATYAINNNLPVLIEKPLSLDLIEARMFYKDIIRKKAKVMVNFIHLYNPIYLEMKNQIKKMGMIKSIETKGGDWGPFRTNTPPMWDWGCHDIAMCIDLLQEEPSAIHKEIIKTKKHPMVPKVQVPQNIKIQLTFSNNIYANIRVGNLMTKKYRYMRINYENAFIEFDDIKKTLSVTNNHGTKYIDSIHNLQMSPLECTIRNFISLICNNDYYNINLAVKVTDLLNKI
jgi:predicted dehydrogenase